MSCPPCCYCGAVSLPDATPKDHFPSVKHLTLCVSVTQKHIVHTDTQAHTCSHTVAPHASLNTMKTWPTPPCHLVKNNSFCNRLWLCFNNSRTLISQNSTTLLFWGITHQSWLLCFGSVKLPGTPKMSHPFFCTLSVRSEVLHIRR